MGTHHFEVNMGKGGAIEPMGLIGVICAAIVFFFLIGYLAGPCYQTKRIPQAGGETKTKFYWSEYTAKNSQGETTTKYDDGQTKLEKVKQIMDATLSFAVFSFILSLVVLVATILYGIEPARNASPLDTGLLKMIILGGGIGLVLCLLLSVCILGFGLPGAAKKDCKKLSQGQSQCDTDNYKKFHYSYKENGTENKGRGGDGYIVACLSFRSCHCCLPLHLQPWRICSQGLIA